MKTSGRSYHGGLRRTPTGKVAPLAWASIWAILFTCGISAQTRYELRLPDPVALSSATRTTISVRWDDSVGKNSGYILERRSIDGSWRRVTIVPHNRARSPQMEANNHFRFVDTELAADTSYCYRLIAFDDKAFSISQERCLRTDAPPSMLETKKLPGFLSAHSPKGFADLVPGEVVSCTDPAIEAAIRAAQEALAEQGIEFPQDKYICETDGWGLDQTFSDFLKGLGGVLAAGVDKAECAGRGLFVVASCPVLTGGLFLTCVGAVTGGGTSPCEVCTETASGFEDCKTEECPNWFLPCLGVLPAAKLCVAAAKGFDKNCLAEN
jgi:hypothetical protein